MVAIDIMTERFWEIDFVKGLAVLAMVVFHFLFDMSFLVDSSINVYSGLFWGIGKFAGITFLLLVGVNLTISYNKAVEKKQNLLRKFGKRAATIFGLGIIITLASFFVFPQYTIWFGILHLIGVSILLAIPFVNRKWIALITAVIVFFVGGIIVQYSYPVSYLLWLGFPPVNFNSFDYYPVFPWFSFVLIGTVLGNLLYPKLIRKISIPDYSTFRPIKFFNWMGRNSLIIYFVHQPILLAIIYFLIGF